MVERHSPTKGAKSEHGYLAVPYDAAGRGLLVLHSWWGLNDFFTGLCERLSHAGYYALCPDLYDGRTAATVVEAEALRSSLRQAHIVEKIEAAVTALRGLVSGESTGIGVLGFSMGGRWALWLADQPHSPVSAAVVFYGTRGGEFTHNHNAFQFHFAGRDDYVSDSAVQRLRNTLRRAERYAEFYSYASASHWFFESDRPEYDEEAAGQAWSRMLPFLSQHVR